MAYTEPGFIISCFQHLKSLQGSVMDEILSLVDMDSLNIEDTDQLDAPKRSLQALNKPQKSSDPKSGIESEGGETGASEEEEPLDSMNIKYFPTMQRQSFTTKSLTQENTNTWRCAILNSMGLSFTIVNSRKRVTVYFYDVNCDESSKIRSLEK